MSNYPTLTEMGVKSTQDVDKYTLRHESETDVLKIYYKRPKGSFLPKSKKFSFLRGKRSVPIETRNAKAFDSLQKISPQLALALEELEQLQAEQAHEKVENPKEQLEAHIAHLEKVVNEKLKEMSDLVKQL